jgi:hypothetical protein
VIWSQTRSCYEEPGVILRFIEQAIKGFFTYLRTKFPEESITPKLHYLEDHVLPEIKVTGFGLGLMSEQGLEMSHRQWNNLKKTVVDMGDKVKRLKTIMRKHLLKVMPEVSQKIMKPAERTKRLSPPESNPIEE